MKSRIAMAVALAGGISLAATACGGSDSSTASSASPSSSASKPAASPSAATDAAPAGLVGAGCAAYAKVVPSGAGSIQGMSQAPVAVAVSNNPVLKSLTAAVSGKVNPKVDLVKNLDGGQFTVFAPVDSAFAKLPPKAVKTLGTPAGAPTLTSILTYHVIVGQLAPDKVAGTHKTVEGANLTVNGSGDKLTVGSGGAHVICGGVKTANATVYLIDSVLMPPTTN